MIFTILPALASESDPPKTVKSCAMGNQLVGLLEGTLVEQELNALPRRHLAAFVLLLAALGSAAFFGQVVALFELFKLLFEVHSGRL
jgi:hypothetical protein